MRYLPLFFISFLSSSIVYSQGSYCVSESSNNDFGYISNVSLAGEVNSSNGSTYSDFSTTQIELTGETEYTIAIEQTGNGNKKNAFSVWIDYNNDYDFDDLGEQVFAQPKTENSQISGSFIIPVNESIAFGEVVRMRVTMEKNSITGPCGNGFTGEVEDYTVKLIYNGLLFSNNVWTPNPPDAQVSTGADTLIKDGTYVVSTNTFVNNLTVNDEAEVLVNPSQTLTVNGNLMVSGKLTLESNSNAYSNLIVHGASSGNVKYKRHVNAFNGTTGNDLIASPLTGQTFEDFAAENPNIFENPNNVNQKLFGPFDKSTGNYQIFSIENGSSNLSHTLDSGIGYRVARDASEDAVSGTTFSFTGEVNTAVVNKSILHTGSYYQEWNLIGNPYTAHIRLSNFLAANNDQFDNQSAGIYGYDGDSSDGWVIWNQAYSEANPNSFITPGQGFFVASQEDGGTISFTPEMRTSETSDDFIQGKVGSSISYFKLRMNAGSKKSSTEFYLTDNASLGLDSGYDSSVFGNVAPEFSIYSHLVNESEGVDMAIQSIGHSDVNTNLSIPLGVEASQGEQITLSIDESSTLDSSIDVILEDNLSNTFTVLNNTDFVITPNTDLSGIGRFYLRFNANALSENDLVFERLQVYYNLKTNLVHIDGLLTDSTHFSMYDLQGRLIMQKDLELNTTSQQIEPPKLSKGVYLLKLDGSAQTKVKKVIIK